MVSNLTASISDKVRQLSMRRDELRSTILSMCAELRQVGADLKEYTKLLGDLKEVDHLMEEPTSFQVIKEAPTLDPFTFSKEEDQTLLQECFPEEFDFERAHQELTEALKKAQDWREPLVESKGWDDIITWPEDLKEVFPTSTPWEEMNPRLVEEAQKPKKVQKLKVVNPTKRPTPKPKKVQKPSSPQSQSVAPTLPPTGEVKRVIMDLPESPEERKALLEECAKGKAFREKLFTQYKGLKSLWADQETARHQAAAKAKAEKQARLAADKAGKRSSDRSKGKKGR